MPDRAESAVSQFASLENMSDEFEINEGVTYLDAASVGPLPRKSRLAMEGHYSLSAREPWKVHRPMGQALDKCRQLAATLINADQESMMYCYNTSFGLSVAAFGLQFQPGDEIIVSDVEFPANVYPWLALQERGVVVHFAKSNNGIPSLESVERLLSKKTKVLAVSFVQFFNGYKLPLAKLSEMARSVDAYFVVDAIQGMGVEPLDFRELKIDLLSSGAQKWLMSPMGIGFFAISQRLQDDLSQAPPSWLSVDWPDFLDLFQYQKPALPDARRFAQGTPPAAHLIAMEKSLELILAVGVENIQRHNHQLLDTVIEFLERDSRYSILSSLEEEHRSAILTFTCPDYQEVFKRLIAAGIICVKREGGIRIAPHIYNTSEDIDRLLKLL